MINEKVNENDIIVLYGASEIGITKYKYLKEVNPHNQYFFCETVRNEIEVQGIPVITLKELYAMDRNRVAIFVYSDNENVLDKKERIELAGFKKVFCCIPGIENFCTVIDNIDGIEKELSDTLKEIFLRVYTCEPAKRLRRSHNSFLILSSVERICKAYKLLDDEESKRTFCNILKYRVSGDTEELKKCVTYPQYFREEFFTFTDKEIFVDAGGAQGDTTLDFLQLVHGAYRKIEIFEAKPSYCIGMKALFGEEIVVHEKGLFSQSGDLYFHEGQHGSYVSLTEKSEEKIAVTSIDEEMIEGVTFIKMDIEGSEMEALKGAEKTIQKDRPKLAICAYHLENDLWEIPIRIKEILPEYKIFMRHHCDEMDEETVCYARI